MQYRHLLRIFTGFAFLFIAALAFRAQAWPPTFGFEFEFTRMDISVAPAQPPYSGLNGKEEGVAGEMAEAVKAACAGGGGCTVEEVAHKYGKGWVVRFEDGFWFRVSFDPRCVEIQTSAQTLEQLRANRDRIQSLIFNTAKSIGLETSAKSGAGHLNMGGLSAFQKIPVAPEPQPAPKGGRIRTFIRRFFGGGNAAPAPQPVPEDDVKLFARFVADYANHPELAMGVIGSADGNSPPLLSLGNKQKRPFQALLEDVETGKVPTLALFASRMVAEVYTRSENPEWGAPHHYQGIGLDKLMQLIGDRDQPFEIRAIFPQISADAAIALAELFQARIEYLRKLDQPATLVDRRIKPSRERTNLTPQQATDYFYEYLVETGFTANDWDRMKILLHPDAQGLVPMRVKEERSRAAKIQRCARLYSLEAW